MILREMDPILETLKISYQALINTAEIQSPVCWGPFSERNIYVRTIHKPGTPDTRKESTHATAL